MLHSSFEQSLALKGFHPARGSYPVGFEEGQKMGGNGRGCADKKSILTKILILRFIEMLNASKKSLKYKLLQ